MADEILPTMDSSVPPEKRRGEGPSLGPEGDSLLGGAVVSPGGKEKAGGKLGDSLAGPGAGAGGGAKQDELATMAGPVAPVKKAAAPVAPPAPVSRGAVAPPPVAERPVASQTDELLTVGATVSSAPVTPKGPVVSAEADFSTLAPTPARRNPASVLAAPESDFERRDPNGKPRNLMSFGGGEEVPSGIGDLSQFEEGGGSPGGMGMTVGAPPNRIGRYEIIKLLGEGGFGSVYLAEQKVPVRRKVALKVVKLGMDTTEVLQRFEAERQALALMDHPNVARVYDAGVTERGQPFFAMELVEGVPLNRYIDDNELPLEMRLLLFMDICRAVQHAHGKGLIHRDLKPGNIIVSTVDGKPLPKVIDFGIAKATGPNLGDTNFQTETGRLIGTPEYMSPEQCAGSVDIDTRTDVYALGVILYEMLTGQLPFDSKMLRAGGIDGITRIIKEVEPQKPSAKVTALDLSKDPGAIEKITKARKMDLRQLQRAIKGDLDWIVIRALEKDRNRRYDTANALAMDVQRHMDNEPVQAGPPDLRYRFGKFARRNKILLGTIAAVAASLVFGLVLATTQYVRAERARAAAVVLLHDKEVALARQQHAYADLSAVNANTGTQRDVATATASFLTEMFASVDPSQAKGRDVTVKEVIGGAIQSLDKGKLADNPIGDATVRSTLGNTLRTLGLAKEGESQLAAALKSYRTVLVRDPDLEMQILSRLGLAERENGKANDAIAHMLEALAIAEKEHGAKSEEVATISQNIALVNLDIGRYGDAESYFRRTLAIFKEKLKPTDPRIAIVRNNLATSYHAQGDNKSAEAIDREALAAMESQFGQDHPATASAIRNLGLVIYDEAAADNMNPKLLAEAEGYLARAVGIWKKVLPPNHPDYRQVLDARADALRDLGRLPEAEAAIRESLSIRETYVGKDSLESCEGLAYLIQIYMLEKRAEEALPLVEDLVGRGGRRLNLAVPAEAKAMTSYWAAKCNVLMELKRPAEAEVAARKALEMRKKLYGVGEWPLANSQSQLGGCLAEQGKYGEAEPLLYEGYQVLKTANLSPPATIERARERLRKLYLATGRADEAEKLK